MGHLSHLYYITDKSTTSYFPVNQFYGQKQRQRGGVQWQSIVLSRKDIKTMAVLGITGITICLLCTYVTYRFLAYPLILSPLSKIPPAHPSAAVSPLWILWIRKTGRENATVYKAHQRHGALVRLGPNEISVNCVDGGIRTVCRCTSALVSFLVAYVDGRSTPEAMPKATGTRSSTPTTRPTCSACPRTHPMQRANVWCRTSTPSPRSSHRPIWLP